MPAEKSESETNPYAWGMPQHEPIGASYEMRDLKAAVRELTTELRALPEKMEQKFVQKEVLDPKIENMQADIAKHASNWDWLVKIFFGSLVTGLVALLVFVIESKH